MGVKNWKRKTKDKEEWRTICKEAKVPQGLQCQKKKKKKKQKKSTYRTSA
jgi:hypothetical protein